MRMTRCLTLLFGIFTIAALTNCSRESSVKENVNLKNNHSRVFAQRESFGSPKDFSDSIANKPVNPADSLPDTLTVTINDTIYLMGLLPYNVDKIYRFQWNLTKPDGKDTVVISKNYPEEQKWVYKKPGVYYPLFIATDGNNSTDTAGTDTKQLYVRVIDTKPFLWVPEDTLWTSNKGDITFPIVTTDSFGTVKKILVDLDASGKEKPQEWKYETHEDNDSLYLTIKNDPKRIDSLGNQKIYVTVIDDDENETTDSVNLHFNRLPKLRIISPKDGAKHNISEPFSIVFEGTDVDNPKSLRYFIYAQNGKNGKPPVKAFDSGDLIAENLIMPICDFWVEDDGEPHNAITLVNSPTTTLNGSIYWDMYVTDGYDIVHMDRIKESDGTTRPWKFYIGDTKSGDGSISGVAKYQGRQNHAGIQIEASTSQRTYIGVTDAKGNYTIKVGGGSYLVRAHSNNKEYAQDSLKEIYVESGAKLILDSTMTLTLKDTVAPFLRVLNFDTLKVRNLEQTIQALDKGSRVKSIAATYNNEEQKLYACYNDTSFRSCKFKIENMKDGVHNIIYTAIDSAGNKKILNQKIVINATTLSLDVNGTQKAIIGENEVLKFTAKVGNALPSADSIKWTYTVGKNTITKKTPADSNGTATLEIPFKDLEKYGKQTFTMTALYKRGNVELSKQVQFGVLILDDTPAIYFTEPGLDTKVTMNDSILFNAKVHPAKNSSKMTIHWICGKDLSEGFSCPADTSVAKDSISKSAILAFKTIGKHKVFVSVTDNNDSSATDSIEVTVFSDKPTIKASTNSNSNKFKINSTVDVFVDASDKMGTVNQIAWGCSNGTVAFDHMETFDNPKQNVTEFKINIRLPGESTDKYKCVFKATDDDGEEGKDSLTFETLLDPPTVVLTTEADSVKINSIEKITAIAKDGLGYITKYEIACSDNLKELKNPEWADMGKATASVKIPSYETSYYCVVQVTDDDGNTARDTATYITLLDLPTVEAIQAEAYKVITINDTIPLNAIAEDKLGKIVKYEWGCGVLPADIGFTISSTIARASITVPEVPHEKYSCIIKVTDDDGNTARDTIHTKILLAPPTVKVKNDTLNARATYNIVLGAYAEDDNDVESDPGEIVKREWSCGKPNEIDRNWKVVSAFDTTWKAPQTAPSGNYYCVARATDNDNNSVTDTTFIIFPTNEPRIDVTDEVIFVNIGDAFTLSAEIKDWQDVDWFSWECKDIDGKSLEKDGKAIHYDYVKNNKNMTVTRDSSYSMHQKDMICIVSARETGTQLVFSDTTSVRVIKQHPKGVITAADTVYPWSGDEQFMDGEPRYFYTPEWGGQNSTKGDLGNPNKYVFNWRFSKTGSYYIGKNDGTLDTALNQFNNAFLRSTNDNGEGRLFCLDFRDSSTTTLTQAFLNRHQAEEVCRTVYFSKAWKNLAKDTVIENVGEQSTPPNMLILKNIPIIAYTTGSNEVVISAFKNGSWTSIDTKSVTDSIIQIEIATNNSDLYLGILDSSKKFTVYKSTKGTSALAKVGEDIENVISPKLLCDNADDPIIVHVDATDKLAYLEKMAANKWSRSKIAIGENTTTFREINATFFSGEKLLVVAIGATAEYKAYSSLLNSNYQSQGGSQEIGSSVSKISLATSGEKVYMGFSNRDVENYGPSVYEGRLSGTGLSWNKYGIFGKPIFEGYLSNRVYVTANGNQVYAAFDDNTRISMSQIHVFRLENDKWHLHGENQLPYFDKNFYNKKKYYLRGSSPVLALDDEGKIYLSMLARATSKTSNNNGPIVMKYVADNWEIH